LLRADHLDDLLVRRREFRAGGFAPTERLAGRADRLTTKTCRSIC